MKIDLKIDMITTTRLESLLTLLIDEMHSCSITVQFEEAVSRGGSWESDTDPGGGSQSSSSSSAPTNTPKSGKRESYEQGKTSGVREWASGHGSTGISGNAGSARGDGRSGGGYQQSGSSNRWWERVEDWFRYTFTGSSSCSESARQEQQRNEYSQQYSNARPGSDSWVYRTRWQQNGFGSSSWARFNSAQFRQQQSGPRTSSNYNWGWDWSGFGSGYQQRFHHNWNNARSFFTNFRANMGGWTSRMRSHVRYARSRVSPLVLDLDNDGLKLVLPERSVYFDIDNDRFMERIGCIDKSETLRRLHMK